MLVQACVCVCGVGGGHKFVLMQAYRVCPTVLDRTSPHVLPT